MTNEIKNLLNGGALFVINHSGGKDSQAMMIELLKIVPLSQILVVHASLGHIEWHGALELAQQQAADAGVPFVVARAEKTFLDMVGRRFDGRPEVPSFPSSKHRQCTSDLKRDPIVREVKRYADAHGFKTIVNCEGIRAAESRQRAKRKDFGVNERENGVAGRTWLNWLPIFELSTFDVWCAIRGSGQRPHQAYYDGNERLSCVFCIMGSANDIYRGSIARPELFAEYVAMEERTGYTMHMSRKSLSDIVAEAKADLAA